MKEIVLSMINPQVHHYTPELQGFELLHPGSHAKMEPINWEEAWSKVFNYTIRGGGRKFQRLERTGEILCLE